VTPTTGQFENLDSQYRVILCDIWGCLHNGVAALPGAVGRLQHWQSEGLTVILLTNAPRPASAVCAQLTALGIRQDCYNAIVTSGDTGLAAARREFPDQSFNFIGSDADKRIIAATGCRTDGDDESQYTICAGFIDGHKNDVAFHDARLRRLSANGANMLCLNPDKIVVRGDSFELCAGALGERYLELGGKVRYFGKPYTPIYDFALETAASILGTPVDKSAILAVGDGSETDMLGAYNLGVDFAFITGGIEAEKIAALGIDVFLHECVAIHQMADYKPAIMAESLE
jgi:HAD superfamily hydrolase (TIGR01459 family)